MIPKYHVEVTSTVPKHYTGTVVIEAKDEQTAREIVQNMYDQDEIDFDGDETDYDSGMLTIDTIKEIEP